MELLLLKRAEHHSNKEQKQKFKHLLPKSSNSKRTTLSFFTDKIRELVILR